jgi:hypothetical protein
VAPSLLHYLLTQLRLRLDAVRSGELDRGALSLEWVAIAIGLVVMAVAVGAFLITHVKSMESNIGTGSQP